jgi:myo-inositol-1(or 4)-monophosphatase
LPASDGLLQALQAILREAGALARKTARGEFKHWTKGEDRSPVSDADIAVDNFLRARLAALVPEAGWLSEETEDDPAERAHPSVWIVDPIDGTRAFLAGFPDWTVSAALIEDGRPRLAALYAPVTDEMFLAARGEGASLNGEPVIASADSGLNKARLAGPKRYLERIASLAPEIETLPKVYSLALRLARVAHGGLDAALASPGSHDWDIAAADLLVHEAGGRLTDLNGQPPRYNRPHIVHGGLIAAGQARHDALLDLVRARKAEFA